MMKHNDLANMRKDKLEDNAIVYCLMQHPLSLVYNVTPYILNPRLTVQQGTFLFPGDIDKSFEYNLKQTIGTSNKLEKVTGRVLIDVNVEQRNKILRELKDRNIHQAALFPDLDGFAESLWTKLAYPEQLGIEAKD